MERRATFADASVLLNYIGLRRLDLLTNLPQRHILITVEVNAEIKRDRAAVEAGLASGAIQLVHHLLGDDADLFARLTQRLSVADASCIVAARALDADLAVDDRRCRLSAAELMPDERLLGTEALLAEAIRAGGLTVEAADTLLVELVRIKYRPKIASFRELGFRVET